MRGYHHARSALSEPIWVVYATDDSADQAVRGLYVMNDIGDLVRSDWDQRFYSWNCGALHEYDEEAWRLYWPQKQQEPAAQPPQVDAAPEQSDLVAQPAPSRPTRRELARIQAKLDRWELQHLRELAASQAELIENLQGDLADARDRQAGAEDSAEFWRDAHHSLADHLDDGTADARCIGLTQSGALLVVQTGAAS